MTCNSTSGTGYAYTANGDRCSVGNVNCTATTNTTFKHDLAHRMTQAKKAGSGSYTQDLTYDALGNRVKEVVGSTTTRSIWDPNGQLALLTQTVAGSTTKDYRYLGSGVLSMKSGSPMHYHYPDHTGSVANLVRANGTLGYSYSYQPYRPFRSSAALRRPTTARSRARPRAVGAWRRSADGRAWRPCSLAYAPRS